MMSTGKYFMYQTVVSSVLLLPWSPAAAAQEAADAPPADGSGSHHGDQQGDQQGKTSVHAVILEPVKVMWRQPQVLRSTVSHRKLHPEDGHAQWRHRLVVVQRWQMLHAGLVAEHHGKNKNRSHWCAIFKC